MSRTNPATIAARLLPPAAFVLLASSCGGNGVSNETGTLECPAGAESCVCQPGNLCDPGLVCVSNRCVDLSGPGMCGNGQIDPGEACDLGALNADTGICKADCELQTCGDGVVGPSEACDDGNTADGDDCTSTCSLPTCGDGIVQAPEACDDGNDDDTDACRTNCLEATCGDGIVQAGVEACDDGNVIDGDGCESDCTVTVMGTCGNGAVDPGELCFEMTTVVTGVGPGRPHLVDIDGDGNLDIVVAQRILPEIWIHPGDGAGGFGTPTKIAVDPDGDPDTPASPLDVAVVDYDGGNGPDLVTIDTAGKVVAVYGQSAGGMFASTPAVVLTGPSGHEPTAILGANLRADGTEDVLVAYRDPAVDDPNATSVEHGFQAFFGEGGFSTSPDNVFVPSAAQFSVDDLAIASLATDQTHVVTLDSQASRFFVHRWDSASKTFAALPSFDDSLAPGTWPRWVDAADVNDDGLDDLLFANWNQTACDYAVSPDACPYDTVTLFYNAQGDPGFAGHIGYAVGKAPTSALFADVDGDGDLDIVSANAFSGTLSVLRGDAGAFGAPQKTSIGPTADVLLLASADLDGNGAVDFVLSRTQANLLVILLSNP